MKRLLLAALAAFLAQTGMARAQEKIATPKAGGPPPVIQEAQPIAVSFDGGPARTRIWASGEYLMWWVKNGPQPLPLVTTRAAAPADFSVAGTTVLYGPSEFSYGMHSGGRVTFGGWLDSDQTFGIEGRGFWLERKGVTGYETQSNAAGNPLFAVPIFDQSIPGESSFLTSSGAGGARRGLFNIDSSSQLWGYELNGLWNAYSTNSIQLGVLGGFRYVDLREIETITVGRTSTGGVPFLGNIFANSAMGSLDSFTARNQFYGGQLGVRAAYNAERWFAQLDAKIAMGDTHRTLSIGGSSALFSPAGNQFAPGGLFAGPSRIGRYSNDSFTAIPEVEFKFGVNVTSRVTAFAGYNFLCWNEVVRPGNNVNRNVNTNEIATSFSYNPNVTVARPAEVINTSSYWAQGINLGLMFKY